MDYGPDSLIWFIIWAVTFAVAYWGLFKDRGV